METWRINANGGGCGEGFEMTHHDLKCWPVPFNEIMTGKKTFEFRRNDRNYKRGDSVTLHLWKPVTQTYEGGSFGPFVIPYVLENGFGLPEGFCIFSIPSPSISIEQIDLLPRWYAEDRGEMRRQTDGQEAESMDEFIRVSDLRKLVEK